MAHIPKSSAVRNAICGLEAQTAGMFGVNLLIQLWFRSWDRGAHGWDNSFLSRLTEHWTEKPGAILMQVRFPRCGKGFFSRI